LPTRHLFQYSTPGWKAAISSALPTALPNKIFRLVLAIAALSVFVPFALCARYALEYQQFYFFSRVHLPSTSFGIDSDISRHVRVVGKVPCTEAVSTDAACAVWHSAQCLLSHRPTHSIAERIAVNGANEVTGALNL